MDEGSFGWLELPGGDDCERTGRFYEEAFGWEIQLDSRTVWFHEPGGHLGGAFVAHLPAAKAGGALLYLATSDAAAALGRVRAAGGTVLLDKTEIEPDIGFRALFRDPAGTTMGLFERASRG